MFLYRSVYTISLFNKFEVELEDFILLLNNPSKKAKKEVSITYSNDNLDFLVFSDSRP